MNQLLYQTKLRRYMVAIPGLEPGLLDYRSSVLPSELYRLIIIWCPWEDSNFRQPGFVVRCSGSAELQGHGGPGRHRTSIIPVMSRLLCQLSYGSISFQKKTLSACLVQPKGFIKSILNVWVRTYVPPFLKFYPSNCIRYQTMRTYFRATYYRSGNTVVFL